MSTNVQQDPFAVADDAKLPPLTYFGQLFVDAHFVVLRKGVGKVPFDPAQHKPEERRTSIKIDLVPLPEMNLQWQVSRELIAESRNWAALVLPSLKALGVSSRELNKCWVKMELIETGRDYTDKNGNEKKETTMRFLSFYPDQDACRAAYLTGRPASGDGDGHNAANIAAEIPGFAPAEGPERAVAQQFIEPLAKQARIQNQANPRAKMVELIAANPLVSRFFTVDSPEVVAVL